MPSGIPFVTTYQPNVKELRELIRDVLPFLCSDREVQKVFSPPPIVSYRIARKIKYIVSNMKNVKQKFLQSHFLLRDHQGFLKDVEVRLIDKTQSSDPTKRVLYSMRTLRTLYPDGLYIEKDY